MIYNEYMVLIISIGVIYYYTFKYSKDLLTKMIGIISGIGGILVSTMFILFNNLNLNANIKHFFTLAIYLIIAIALILITLYSWKVRKDPEKKIAAYAWLCTIIGSILIVLRLYFKYYW